MTVGASGTETGAPDANDRAIAFDPSGSTTTTFVVAEMRRRLETAAADRPPTPACTKRRSGGRDIWSRNSSKSVLYPVITSLANVRSSSVASAPTVSGQYQ